MPYILSVDDSRTMRRVIGSTIEVLGFETLEAMDGQEALAVLAEHHQDIALVLLDVNMPVMDGFACLEAIKASADFGHIPVVMVTTEAERKNIVRAIRLGAANYVTKPFTPEDLSTKILDTLNG
mgnify:CR=1 FL=1